MTEKTEAKSRWPREGKAYALKSSASRAAREDGLVDGQFNIESKGKGKEEKFFYKVTDAHRKVTEQMENSPQKVKASEPPKPPEPPKPEPKKVKCPHCELVFKDTSTGTAEKNLESHIERKHPVVIDEPKKELRVVDTTDPVQAAAYQEEIKAAVPAPSAPEGDVKSATSGQPSRTVTSNAPRGAPVTKIPSWAQAAPKKSQVELPTKVVWHIADEMTAANPEVPRKTVIQECVRRGIAYYTARTQYQQWLTAKRESDANAAKANGKK